MRHKVVKVRQKWLCSLRCELEWANHVVDVRWQKTLCSWIILMMRVNSRQDEQQTALKRWIDGETCQSSAACFWYGWCSLFASQAP